MASEYLMKKYKDVKPAEPVELSPKAKRRNWWEYHKIYFLVGAIALSAVFSFVWDMTHKEEADYQIAFVGQSGLSDTAAEEISRRMSDLLPDRTGDGKVLVQVHVYATGDLYSDAAVMSLSGDIMQGNSSVYIVEDLMAAQEQYAMFYQTDGTLPAEDAATFDCAGFAWSDCPAVADIDLGGTYYVTQRGWVNDDQIKKNRGTELLWQVITENAR